MIEQTKLPAYFNYCTFQKKLDKKTIKAYKIDLTQFFDFVDHTQTDIITRSTIEDYIERLSQQYKTTSIKRKYASLKTYFSYLQYMELILNNPFDKIKLRLKEELILPRVFQINILENLLKEAYSLAKKPLLTDYQKFVSTRNIAILELLFSTGMRVSELCNLTLNQVDTKNQQVLIKGKGSKERILYLSNSEVIIALQNYLLLRITMTSSHEYFFINRTNNRLSEQSVRIIIKQLVTNTGCPLHITPHMFRHTLATTLLDEGVDCRYIQNILGHSSIRTTERYTHVSLNMQKKVLLKKHPRHRLNINLNEMI